MSKLPNLWHILLFIFMKFINTQTYCGIGQINYNVSFPTKKVPKTANENFHPIQIFIDKTSIQNDMPQKKLNYTNIALNEVVKILEKLIKVKSLNYKISIDENDLNNWRIQDYDTKILNGIDTDLIVIIKYVEENYYMSSEPKYIDKDTKRPIVGIIYISDKFTYDIYSKNNENNNIYYAKSLLLHQFIHILGFLYQTFHSFPMGIDNVIIHTDSDQRSRMPRNYIKTPKVMEFAKKYYGCQDIIGVDLEDQDGGTNSHWEARILLGEIMNCDFYSLEQVISEFTLALLEDSEWYKVNYFTGGLMRYGKNKGCSFLTGDCPIISKYKNEFFNIEEEKSSCSSGRQSRGYSKTKEISSEDIENYIRSYYYKGYYIYADYCFVFVSKSEEEINDFYIGNCNKGNGNYGTSIRYSNNRPYPNRQLPRELGEKYDYNSFCVLTSISIKDTTEFYKFSNDIIHPMCYPMFCSEKSLTIQIYNQFLVCPRGGGKVKVGGIYEGYIFCPDFNLICTGTDICNDMFDCIEKESLVRNGTFNYDYEIKTSQIYSELINAEPETLVYELSENGKCPKDCGQCNNLRQCIQCREGFNFIGIKEDEDLPIICNNQTNISIGYYTSKDLFNNIIYYPCFNNCDKCNKTHCLSCDNYHKLDENNIFCIEKVEHCGIYENITYTCIKCSNEYVFIGEDRTKCLIIDKSKYYSTDNGISYHLCNSSISHCDKCNNSFTCQLCMISYYFLEENRNICYNDKNLTKYFTEDEGVSYFPCDKSFNYCDECIDRYHCTKCKINYYLVNENGFISCKDVDPKKYYKKGIYYYSCLNAIDNCDECEDDKICNKCISNYYFLKDNKTYCRNDLNITYKYYTNDYGISYYPCNTNFLYCDECINESTCTKCINKYGFLINDYSKCIFVANNKFFSLDGGITFNFCNSSLPNCDECLNNQYCTKCYENYYFIKNDRTRCYNDKDLSKYYTEDHGASYFPCNEAIDYCDICFNNKSYCSQCETYNGYYFIGNNRTICRNDANLSKYYTEDYGISYYPCNEAIPNCETCLQKDKCTKCIINYFFIGNDRKICYNKIDYKKYFTKDNGLSYFPCNSSIEHCDECFNQYYCMKCYSSYILLFESSNECYEEFLYLDNDNYFKLNETHYKKCSSSIVNCDKCTSFDNCIKCQNNYYFINDNHTLCIYENEILPKDEFFKLDEENYYSCSFQNAVANCLKCINESFCQKCKEGYALIYNISNKCFNKENLKIGYYHNLESTIYYPCLEHCSRCENGLECLECDENYLLLNEGTLCGNCELNIENNNVEFNENLIKIEDYLNFKKDDLVLHYINENYDYSITIFKAWECTELLWKKNYYKFNTSNLNALLNKKLHIDKNNLIYVFITKSFKNYLGIYDSSNKNKIDIENKCSQCIESGFEIINNYSNKIEKILGPTFLYKIKNNNIDIFNKENKYITNICQNFTISKIDLSIPDRINNLYIGDFSNDIICTDKNCEIKSYTINNFHGLCICPINSDLNILNLSNINILNSGKKENSFDISLSVFKCIKEGFNKDILSNTGFYLYTIFIFIQILCFIFFVCFEKKNINLSPSKKSISNPPKNENEEILFVENFDVLEEVINNDNSFQCSEKNIQEKDEGELIEDINSYSVDFEQSTNPYINTNNNNNNKDKQSIKTDIKSEIELENKEKKSNIIRQETNNRLLDKENKNQNDHNVSSSRHKLKKIKDKKVMKINKSDINLKYMDMLSLNRKSKNQNKKSDFYANTEGNERINKLSYKKVIKSKNKNNDKNFSDMSARSKEELINLRDKISSIKRSIIASPDNISFEEAKSRDNLSFCGFYWYLLGLKQPLLNLASQIKMFKITESFVPSGVKVIRFIFMLGLNFFINSLFISQKYFSAKFKYFDEKYNLRHKNVGMEISSKERFSYAFKHTFLFSVYSFLICYAIQAVINYFFFNLRKRINLIIVNNSNVEEEMKDYLDTVRIKYKFIFMINVILLLLFSLYIINFSSVYRGGDLDYIAGAILTFAFLQIFPFFVCFFLAIIRYCGLKKSEQNIYKFSQVMAY